MFSNCSNLKNIDFGNLDTRHITSMAGMFYNCSKSVTLDLSPLDTSNVEYMSSMFGRCRSLTFLDLSGFITSNVKAMTTMFYECRSLNTLNLSTFDTSKVTTMQQMFSGCSSLTRLNIPNFKTNNVNNMYPMFKDCNSLTTLDLTSFDTSNVITMNNMFRNCDNLISLKLNSFNTTNVLDMESMFENCSHILSLDLSTFDTSNTKSMYQMFKGCSNLSELDLSTFNTKNISTSFSTHNMFLDMNNLSKLILNANFKFGKHTGLSQPHNDIYWIDKTGQKFTNSDSLIHYHNQNNETNTYRFQKDIQIHYTTQENKKIYDSQTVSCYIGEYYDFTHDDYMLNIDGYIIDKSQFPTNTQGIMTSETTDITYKYKISETIEEVNKETSPENNIHNQSVLPKTGDTTFNLTKLLIVSVLSLISFLKLKKHI